ncbi:uncharacterized protein LAESUDRAFT_526138 [Laetiporus sulphureus 93-53]|uniref:Uncharacterized protein n=1 Tax=Laetiporus sulphureus 93-53 TaxID=1314785 RepID=A0A165BD37_9APHY|nr:uncharacterized protein LAESUDRAFT_526138 [Laetiporus sulphureus 93-53]KZT00778.1 hypothetical protein LAESUDRAFT_526138 [Laetiporus sulphureus 93-53]
MAKSLTKRLLIRRQTVGELQRRGQTRRMRPPRKLKQMRRVQGARTRSSSNSQRTLRKAGRKRKVDEVRERSNPSHWRRTGGADRSTVVLFCSINDSSATATVMVVFILLLEIEPSALLRWRLLE